MSDRNDSSGFPPFCPNCDDKGCEFCAPAPMPAEAACDVTFEEVFGEEGELTEPADCPICDGKAEVDEGNEVYCPRCGWRAMESLDDYDDDRQPSEYDEWQDYYGGDDYDHGQFDNDEGDF